MSEYPPQVERLKQAVLSLPGAAACEIGLKSLDQFSPDDLSLPGDFADLPQVAIYRTGGGKEGEMIVQVEVMFKQSYLGWVALEFLAWWVRDQARSGEAMQLRALALPPKAYDRQLGRTLKFILEVFLANPEGDMSLILAKTDALAEDIEESIEMYREEIDNPVTQADAPELW